MAARIATSPARCAQEDPPPSGSAHDEKGCVKFTLDLLLPNTTRPTPSVRAHLQGILLVGRPLWDAPRRPDTRHRHCFGTYSPVSTANYELGSKPIATVGSPGRLSPRDHTLYTGPAVKTCPRRRTTLPRPCQGTAYGSRRGDSLSPHLRIPHDTRHHTQLRMPDVAAPRKPHSAHTQVPAAADRRSSYRYSWTAVPLRSCRPSARQHHGASGRSSRCGRLSLATLTSM